MSKEDIQSGEELLKTKQNERKIRKSKKKIGFIKSFLRFLTAIAVVYAVYVCLQLNGWYLPESSFVNFNNIQIENNNIVKTTKIKNIIKNSQVSDKPIFMNNMNNIKQKILSLTPIEKVYIRRFAFPARLTILVTEITPIISVYPDINSQSVAAFTRDAKIITGSDYLPLPNNIKTVKVLSVVSKNDDFHKWDKTKIEKIEKLAKYIETFSNEDIEYMDLRNPYDVYIKIKSANLRLGKFDDEIYARIERLPSVLPQIKQVESNIKYIDLRWDNVFLKL